MPTKIRRSTSHPTRLANKITLRGAIFGDLKYVIESTGPGTIGSATPRESPTVRLDDHSHTLAILNAYHHWDDAWAGTTCPASNHKIRLDYFEQIDSIISEAFVFTRSHFPQTGSAVGGLNLSLGDGTIQYDQLGTDEFTDFDVFGSLDEFHKYSWGQRTQINEVNGQAVFVDLFNDAQELENFHYPSSVTVLLSATIQASDTVVSEASLDSLFDFDYGFPTYDTGEPDFPYQGQQHPDQDDTPFSTSFSTNPSTTFFQSVGTVPVEEISVRALSDHEQWVEGNPEPPTYVFSAGNEGDTAPGHTSESHDIDTGSVTMLYSVPSTGFSDFVAIDNAASTVLNGGPPFSGATCVANITTPCA